MGLIPIPEILFNFLFLKLANNCTLDIQGDLKKMSPLAFKPNNLQLMHRTTLPDTAFERADNFRSNECITLCSPFK